MDKSQDSHLSTGPAADNQGAVRQHHLMAQGKPVDGQKEPAGKLDTSNCVGNAPKAY